MSERGLAGSPLSSGQLCVAGRGDRMMRSIALVYEHWYERCRFGHRRVHILLPREGWIVDRKRCNGSTRRGG